MKKIFLGLGMSLLLTSHVHAQAQVSSLRSFEPQASPIDSPNRSEPDQTLSRSTGTLPDSPLPKQATPCPLSNPSCGGTSFRERNDLNGLRSVASPHHRVADKKFWIVTGAVAGSTALHVLAVNHCRHTVGIENCEGKYGTFRVMQGLNIGFAAGMAAIGYGWKKMDDGDGAGHSKWWTIPLGTAAFFGFTAIQQYRKHCPAGTHFSVYECE